MEALERRTLFRWLSLPALGLQLTCLFAATVWSRPVQRFQHMFVLFPFIAYFR